MRPVCSVGPGDGQDTDSAAVPWPGAAPRRTTQRAAAATETGAARFRSDPAAEFRRGEPTGLCHSRARRHHDHGQDDQGAARLPRRYGKTERENTKACQHSLDSTGQPLREAPHPAPTATLLQSCTVNRHSTNPRERCLTAPIAAAQHLYSCVDTRQPHLTSGLHCTALRTGLIQATCTTRCI